MEQGYESDTSSVDHVTDHAPGQWCDLDSNGSPEADCKRELRETRQLPHSNSGASAEARPRDRRASNGKRAQGGKRGLSRRRSDQEQHLAFAAETTIMGTPTREGSGGRGGSSSALHGASGASHCGCGNRYMDDSRFCRMCGQPRRMDAMGRSASSFGWGTAPVEAPVESTPLPPALQLNAMPPAADASLRQVISWCAVANEEGGPELEPVRRRPVHLVYAFGTRAGSWRTCFPFAAPGSSLMTSGFFRALETPEFDLKIGRFHCTKYLFEQVSAKNCTFSLHEFAHFHRREGAPLTPNPPSLFWSFRALDPHLGVCSRPTNLQAAGGGVRLPHTRSSRRRLWLGRMLVATRNAMHIVITVAILPAMLTCPRLLVVLAGWSDVSRLQLTTSSSLPSLSALSATSSPRTQS